MAQRWSNFHNLPLSRQIANGLEEEVYAMDLISDEDWYRYNRLRAATPTWESLWGDGGRLGFHRYQKTIHPLGVQADQILHYHHPPELAPRFISFKSIDYNQTFQIIHRLVQGAS